LNISHDVRWWGSDGARVGGGGCRRPGLEADEIGAGAQELETETEKERGEGYSGGGE
jgi:hypothetical protein